MTDLDELERLAKGATPGPWSVCRHLQSVDADEACTCGYRGVVYGPEHDVPMAICQPGHDAEPEGEEGLGPQNYERATQIANAQHIAAANPSTILALTAEVRRLRTALDNRPAMNAGLIEAYSIWTASVYESDMSAHSGETKQ